MGESHQTEFPLSRGRQCRSEQTYGARGKSFLRASQSSQQKQQDSIDSTVHTRYYNKLYTVNRMSMQA